MRSRQRIAARVIFLVNAACLFLPAANGLLPFSQTPFGGEIPGGDQGRMDGTIVAINDGGGGNVLSIAAKSSSRGVISGMMYEDLDGNGVRSEEEPPAAEALVSLSGQIERTMYTDLEGEFKFTGLDSGNYTVSDIRPGGVPTSPSGGYALFLGVNDTVSNLVFGDYFPWNSIAGSIFNDEDEDGSRETGEEPLGGWTVEISGAITRHATTATDSLGWFIFLLVDRGPSLVNIRPPAGWEQNSPVLQQGYEIIFDGYDHHLSGIEFGCHVSPARLKLTLTVHDHANFARDIWWGIRPAATYGIWGFDPKCTITDYSEGELELPPFLPALFDARFVDPRGFPGQFGNGSWTDMRDFLSLLQVDTHVVRFSPSRDYGGHYPMTLAWSRSVVANAFNGPVVLSLPDGMTVDMKARDSVVISDSLIGSATIISGRPALSSVYLRRWEMVSLPSAVADSRVKSLLRTSTSRAYSFSSASGYLGHDSIESGPGYWVKYITGVESMSRGGSPRLADTVAVDSGWNMVGALSVPIPVDGITTDPPGIALSNVFGFNGRYVVAESLMPGRAYWINAAAPGGIILSSQPLHRGAGSGDSWREIAGSSGRILVRDAAGNEGFLYFTRQRAAVEHAPPVPLLPPAPPEGAFDVRFASNRLIEFVPEAATITLPVSISAEAYPVTVEAASIGDQAEIRLMIKGEEIPLGIGRACVLDSARNGLSLTIQICTEAPAECQLFQNYPNPFNPATTIEYSLPSESRTTLRIYDVLGRLVETLRDGIEGPGTYSAIWKGNGWASGIYYYRLDAWSTARREASFTQIKQMLLAK